MFRQIGPAEYLFFPIVVGLFLIPAIYAIVDLIKRPPEQFPRFAKAGTSDKTGWIVALIVGWLIGLGWIVAIVYLIIVRRKMGPVRSGPAPGGPPEFPASRPGLRASVRRRSQLSTPYPLP
jgi:hypothetical protein